MALDNFPRKAYSIVLAAGAWTALSNQPCVIPQQAASNAAGGIVLKRPSLVQTSALCFSTFSQVHMAYLGYAGPDICTGSCTPHSPFCLLLGA